ncbi:CDP-diacylglycerol--glycerol-3-phosphate 3-phosphatidyltransferase [Adlercreutzia sp. ZJ141]|uniref:CDP-diacylglycerol--glycerol-3-phosphate 3-phosphatidyltransferase n=1 Tax=Adlercreutzia sp. ZJ141 TaxID=2709406 RepID=UPI0013EC6F87|nr:CDP-diacylglycerol--glycerol-3-phosphate 3-phosphatidyltransferase [Adlercreutzia sp. ZJ141]
MAQEPQERLWTPANIVTLTRICFVPVFVVVFLAPWFDWFPFLDGGEVWKPWVAAAVFVLIAATDALDGYLARSRGEVTNFGKFMDPLADKILVLAALLSLTELGVLPAWVTLIIMSREFIVSGIRMIAANQGTVIAASWYGKAKTVTQMVAIVLFILMDGVPFESGDNPLQNPLYIIAWLVMIVALVLTIVSMLDYFVKAKQLLGFAPSGKRATADPDTAAQPVSESLIELLAQNLDATRAEDETYTRAATEAELALAQDRALVETASSVITAAAKRGVTIGTAESLTGGGICAALTAVPGSSTVVRGGIASYMNEVKYAALHVGSRTLADDGAVSKQVALDMARGARQALGCDVAVSVTGIAGPTGAEPSKPVGTVWIGWANAHEAQAMRLFVPGDRSQVRRLTVRAALETLASEVTEK